MQWKRHIPGSAGLAIIIAAFLLTLPFYLKRIAAFGCADDCFNIVAGHFILQGKHLFSEIFFNHMPLGADLSYVVQAVTGPDSLYALIKYHHLATWALGMAGGILLYLRFGFAAIPFVLLYETTKFYVFGDRFLAEALIAYPAAYVTGVLSSYAEGGKRRNGDAVAMGFIAWFAVFSREPFAVFGGIVLALYLVMAGNAKQRIVAVLSFLVPTVLELAIHPLPDMFDGVWTLNAAYRFGDGSIGGVSLPVSFLYPFRLTTFGNGTILWTVLRAATTVFAALILWPLVHGKWKAASVVLTVLTLLNLRPVPLGREYFETFHMAPWYAALLFAVPVMGWGKSWARAGISVLYAALVLYAVFSPGSFFRTRVDTQNEFTAYYAHAYVNGEVVARLSGPGDTFFVEMWDDLMYIPAGLPSPYRYSWYTSFMPSVPRFVRARDTMFAENPPAFYFGACRPGENYSFPLPEYRKPDYVQLLVSGKPSCLYVRKDKMRGIPESAWSSVQRLEYSRPGEVPE